MKNTTVKKNNKLLNIAKILRRNMTRQEKHLWYDFLRYYPVKIYKQRIIEDFIADFYCHQARLVIEVDGSQHQTLKGQFEDKLRTYALEQYDLLVVRFSNENIDNDFPNVCDTIDRIIKTRM